MNENEWMRFARIKEFIYVETETYYYFSGIVIPLVRSFYLLFLI